MRLLALAVFLFAAIGCRGTQTYTVPDVPPTATALVLSDDELPRTVYASAWGAFSASGWDVVASDPETFAFSVSPPDAGGAVDLVVEAEVEYGRAVAARAVAESDDHALLARAAAVLAAIPGDLTVR